MSTSKSQEMRRKRKERREEIALLGSTRVVEQVPTPDDARVMHGRKIRPGVRPLLPVRSKRFLPYLTERQQRRGKVRTARSWGRMLAMLKDTGMTLEEFVETLSPEELVYGKLKNKDGTFGGRPPTWVPAEFHRACIRELLRRGKRMWQESYLEAIDAMVAIASGQVRGATPGERIKAAQFVIERIEGKVPERLEIGADSPWQMIISDIVTEVPESAVQQAKAARLELTEAVQREIHEAEVVEDRPTTRRVRRSR